MSNYIQLVSWGSKVGTFLPPYVRTLLTCMSGSWGPHVSMWTKFHPKWCCAFSQREIGLGHHHRLRRPTRNPILWWMPSHEALPYTPTPPPNYCRLAFLFCSLFLLFAFRFLTATNQLFCYNSFAVLPWSFLRTHNPSNSIAGASEPPDSQLPEWHKFWVTK